VSDSYTTEELVAWAENLLSGLGPEMKRLSMNGDNEGFGKAAQDADMLNAIIARLRAGDALYEAIILDYMVRVSPGVSHYDIMPKKLRKAIAGYKEGQ